MEFSEGGFLPDSDNIEDAKCRGEDQSITIPIKKSECCRYCGGMPVTLEIRRIFSICVCSSCLRTQMKFITKTQCKSKYLLTEEELNEFSHLSRLNPHKGAWNDMQLYLEKEILEFSLAKHGSIEQIEQIKELRIARLKKRKMDKAKGKVKELKRKTFLAPLQDKHRHKFISKGKFSECDCGMAIEEEEI